MDSARHVACSRAGASLRCGETDEESEESWEVDEQGYLMINGVPMKSWREMRQERREARPLVSMLGSEGGDGPLPAERGVSECAFSVVVQVMEHFECVALFEIEIIVAGGHMVVYKPESWAAADEVDYWSWLRAAHVPHAP